MTVPNVPGLRVNIVPGPKGARIDVHPLDVCIDPLVGRDWRLITACVARLELLGGSHGQDLAAPKLGGSLFLGVGLPRIRTPAIAASDRYSGRKLTQLHLSISPRTLLSTASPTSSKNLCHLGRSLSRLPGPSPNPLEEEYSAHFM